MAGVVAVNRIRASSREALEALVEAFRGRRGLVDSMPGFECFALLVDWDRLEALVVTRWRDRESLEKWLWSEEFRRAHRGARLEGVESEGGVYEVVLGDC